MRSTVMPDTAVESAESGLVANVDEMRGGIGIVVGITMPMPPLISSTFATSPDSALSTAVSGITVDLIFRLDLGTAGADKFEAAVRTTLRSMGIFEREIVSITILPGSAIARIVLVAPETADLLIAFASRGISVSIEGAITVG